MLIVFFLFLKEIILKHIVIYDSWFVKYYDK